ncbi:hypothetical protein SVIOM342S_02016 [Streptomyces violaceorubidus]
MPRGRAREDLPRCPAGDLEFAGQYDVQRGECGRVRRTQGTARLRVEGRRPLVEVARRLQCAAGACVAQHQQRRPPGPSGDVPAEGGAALGGQRVPHTDAFDGDTGPAGPPEQPGAHGQPVGQLGAVRVADVGAQVHVQVDAEAAEGAPRTLRVDLGPGGVRGSDHHEPVRPGRGEHPQRVRARGARGVQLGCGTRGDLRYEERWAGADGGGDKHDRQRIAVPPPPAAPPAVSRSRSRSPRPAGAREHQSSAGPAAHRPAWPAPRCCASPRRRPRACGARRAPRPRRGGGAGRRR